MACQQTVPQTQTQTFVPVCASVICEAPGVIYVSIDPDVWKIRCRQCQEKTEHKCALRKLKNKFRGTFTKRRLSSKRGASSSDGGSDEEGGRSGKAKKRGEEVGKETSSNSISKRGSSKFSRKDDAAGAAEGTVLAASAGGGKEVAKERRRRTGPGKLDDIEEERNRLKPEEQVPDDHCACPDRPRGPSKPGVCLCEVYKPLNFMLELEVTGEFKPAFVPRLRKGKE